MKIRYNEGFKLKKCMGIAMKKVGYNSCESSQCGTVGSLFATETSKNQPLLLSQTTTSSEVKDNEDASSSEVKGGRKKRRKRVKKMDLEDLLPMELWYCWCLAR